MSAQQILFQFYRGEYITPKLSPVGLKPAEDNLEMICDCDDGGECCGY